MITVKNERGKQVVYILGKRAFMLSGPAIALTPNVETQPVQWDNIEGKPTIPVVSGLSDTIVFNSPEGTHTVVINNGLITSWEITI